MSSTEPLDYLFAQTFALEGACNWSVTDDTGTNVVNINGTTGKRWYRHVAARTSSAARTQLDPGDFLHWVALALGPTRWEVEMRPNARVRITSRNSGAALLDVSGSLVVAFLLGFNSSIGSPVLSFPETDSFVDAPCPPTHCIVATQFWPDSGWTRTAQKLSGVTTATGATTAWSNRKQGLMREGEIGLIPYDWAFASTVDAGTPMFPAETVDEERELEPAADEPGQEPPWSVLDQMGVQVDQRWGCIFGTLQEVLAGTSTRFDVCSVTLESLRADNSNRPSIAGYDRRWQQPIAFRRIAKGVRA